MIFHMSLGRVLGMLGGMGMVAMGQMRVMRSFLVMAGLVMSGGLMVMVRRKLVMPSGVLVMISCFLRHV